MPPCAAPRMNVPFWRIASAPMRPLTLITTGGLLLRPNCAIGLGPIAVHGPCEVDRPGRLERSSGPCGRSPPRREAAPACSLLSCVSPAVAGEDVGRVGVQAAGLPHLRRGAPQETSVPGTITGLSPLGAGIGGRAPAGDDRRREHRNAYEQTRSARAGHLSPSSYPFDYCVTDIHRRNGAAESGSAGTSSSSPNPSPTPAA